MSDCLHCDIHELLESRRQAQQTDLSEIAANVTQVLADLILLPPDQQTMRMADVLANLGGMVLQKMRTRTHRTLADSGTDVMLGAAGVSQ